MQFQSYGISDVGRKRTKNEDSYLINEENALFVIADGMGGHQGGEYASRIAVSTIEEVVRSITEDPDMTLKQDVVLRPRDFEEQARYAVQTASVRIFEKAVSDPSLRGMGTTSVVVILRDNKAICAHVGDSRIYLIRDGELTQLTEDHSLVEEQLKAGIINASEAKSHKLKNIITRSVGFQEEVEVDTKSVHLKKGDRFVMCTDGLSNMLAAEDILAVGKDGTLRESSGRMIDLANERGGDDNISVIMIEIVSVDDILDEPTEDISR